MNCPMCMQLMKEHSSTSYVPFYHYEDEETYYTKQKIVTYTCVKYKVTCRNDVWNLPENDRPTEKQQLAISFIQDVLGLPMMGLLNMMPGYS